MRIWTRPISVEILTGIHADTAVQRLGIEFTEVGDDFIQWRPPSGDISTLGLVDFSICPHLAPDGMPGNTMAEAEQWAAGISGPAYAVDDQTAFKVVDGAVEIVSEGHWKQLR